MSATYDIQKFNADGKVFYKVFRKYQKKGGGLAYEQCGSFDRLDRAEEYVKALEREDKRHDSFG